MTIELKANRSISWARPQGCPSNAETLKIFAGHDEGDLALEVGVAKWTGADSPTREALLKLHKDRAGQGINPVVILAVSGEKAWLLGPNSQAAVVGPLAVDHAQRLLQSAIDEPSGLDARRALNQTYEAIAATSTGGAEKDALRGVGNAGLFATHELRNGVRQRADWAQACERSKEVMSLRRHDLIKKLGYSVEDVGGNASLLKSKGENPRAVAVILLDNETFDGQSNRFAVSPVAFGLQVADRKEVSWLMLLRKDTIRLYPARLDLGVGRKGLAETYFELNLAVADDSTAGFLSLIFSAEALAENGSCYEILRSSSQYAVGLGARLRDKVYGEIVPQLSLAVAAQLPNLGVPMDREGLNRAYQITLRIFFRMLFQAYADDRKLLPYGENDEYTKNAIKSFAKNLINDGDLEFDDQSSSYWDDLIQVWRAIDTGSKRFGIPAYNGGLFSSDEELQPDGSLIERLRLTDDIIGRVLRALLIDVADDGTVGPIDFRSLSVREFGTIYEGLLESNLGLADTDLVLDDKDTWIPAPKNAKLEPGRSAKKGTVYFHDTSGARKGTGSYFTPSFVVEHLLERSLDPALDAHLERVKAVLEDGDQVGAADLFFDFKVADLAMGSAHFLTAAIDHIEQRMAGFLDTHPIPGVTNELRRLEEAAKEKLGENATVPEPSSLLRRQIARRCIYGLDINPVAVELARVSIWIHTFVRGLPMSSLDHTLVCANSLTGIGTVAEALDVLVPKRRPGVVTLFDEALYEALTRARDVLVEVAKASELDSKESKAASRATMKARKDAEEAKLLFDAAVLTRIGRAGLVTGSDVPTIADAAATSEAQEALAPLRPAHMPLLFPEVFLRDDGGFDVLIGNPPWEKIKVEVSRWWALRFPGLRSLPQGEQDERIKKLRKERPDLAAEHDSDVEGNATARAAIVKGPYPGIGKGDPDLYQAFAWRNWTLLRLNGRLGVVMPRSLVAEAGGAEWRNNVFENGQFSDVALIVNSGRWMFDIHPQMSIALISVERLDAPGETVTLCGPFNSRAEFDLGVNARTTFPASEFRTWGSGAAFPILSSAEDGEVYLTMKKHPRLDTDESDWRARPYRELDTSLDKKYFQLDEVPDDWYPVYKGESFNLWAPDTGTYYGGVNPTVIVPVLQKKRQAGAKLKSSPFSEFDPALIRDQSTLSIHYARIGLRKITNKTNSRTVIACLVPPNVAMSDGAPFMLFPRGGPEAEAYLLGVLASIPLDWIARRTVEVNMTYHILNGFPIPRPTVDSPLRVRIVQIAGSLAAVDKRFATWAKAVGVKVGSVKDDDKADLEAELDALVAHLYGLTRDQVEHIFKTFHKGWKYEPRLAQVLAHFDSIAKTKK
jgi:hypothetical protein